MLWSVADWIAARFHTRRTGVADYDTHEELETSTDEYEYVEHPFEQPPEFQAVELGDYTIDLKTLTTPDGRMRYHGQIGLSDTRESREETRRILAKYHCMSMLEQIHTPDEGVVIVYELGRVVLKKAVFA